MVTPEVLLGRFVIPVEHGLIYVRDRDSTEAHLSWDPSTSHIDVGEDSIAFAVRPSVDGHVSINVWDGARADEAAEDYFKGDLRTPSRYLLLHDADHSLVFSAVVDADVSRVHIMADQLGNASEIVICLGA